MSELRFKIKEYFYGDVYPVYVDDEHYNMYDIGRFQVKVFYREYFDTLLPNIGNVYTGDDAAGAENPTFYIYESNPDGEQVPSLIFPDAYNYDGVEPTNIHYKHLDRWVYVSKDTLDGVIYDKWQKIEGITESEESYVYTHSWESSAKSIIYTSEIVDVEKFEMEGADLALHELATEDKISTTDIAVYISEDDLKNIRPEYIAGGASIFGIEGSIGPRDSEAEHYIKAGVYELDTSSTNDRDQYAIDIDFAKSNPISKGFYHIKGGAELRGTKIKDHQIGFSENDSQLVSFSDLNLIYLAPDGATVISKEQYLEEASVNTTYGRFQCSSHDGYTIGSNITCFAKLHPITEDSYYELEFYANNIESGVPSGIVFAYNSSASANPCLWGVFNNSSTNTEPMGCELEIRSTSGTALDTVKFLDQLAETSRDRFGRYKIIYDGLQASIYTYRAVAPDDAYKITTLMLPSSEYYVALGIVDSGVIQNAVIRNTSTHYVELIDDMDLRSYYDNFGLASGITNLDYLVAIPEDLKIPKGTSKYIYDVLHPFISGELRYDEYMRIDDDLNLPDFCSKYGRIIDREIEFELPSGEICSGLYITPAGIFTTKASDSSQLVLYKAMKAEPDPMHFGIPGSYDSETDTICGVWRVSQLPQMHDGRDYISQIQCVISFRLGDQYYKDVVATFVDGYSGQALGANIPGKGSTNLYSCTSGYEFPADGFNCYIDFGNSPIQAKEILAEGATNLYSEIDGISATKRLALSLTPLSEEHFAALL